MENLACPIVEIECKADPSGKEGSVKAIAAVFGKRDLDDDVFEAGAFKAGLKERPEFPMLLGHGPEDNRDAGVCGVWDDNHETKEGLIVEGRFALKTRQGAECFELVQMKALTQLSVGHVVKEREYKMEGEGAGQMVRHIVRSDVFHVGWTHRGAQPWTKALSLKSRLSAVSGDEERRFESGRILRDVGFSEEEVKAMMSALPSAKPDPDDGDDFKGLSAAVVAAEDRLKKLAAGF